MTKEHSGQALHFENGYLHRIDGPAIEWPNNTKLWYINGKLHREDGPAIECANGDKLWYINGIDIQDIKNIFIKLKKDSIYEIKYLNNMDIYL